MGLTLEGSRFTPVTNSPHLDSGDAGPQALDLGYARLDVDRASRTGDPEVVYGAGKSPEHVVELLTTLHAAHPDVPCSPPGSPTARVDAVAHELPAAELDPVAHGRDPRPDARARGRVAIVSAGTSDAPVAREAALTAQVFGAGVELINDVGVAGLHRVLGVRDRLAAADCLIVVAGMEGALPSVVGGLTGVPLVAVPTSVGYGASFGGLAALLAMLNSCAPGVTVVNIDNGFGAGVFAARVARNAAPVARPPSRQPHDRLDRRRLRRQRRHAAGRARRRGRRPRRDPVGGRAVAPEPVEITTEQVPRGSIQRPAGTRRGRRLRDASRPRRRPRLIEDAPLADEVKRHATRRVRPARRAEAHVHGVSPDEVHFHEVGALDAIADIVGVCAGMVQLGLDALHCSPVAVGSGSVDSARAAERPATGRRRAAARHPDVRRSGRASSCVRPPAPPCSRTG